MLFLCLDGKIRQHMAYNMPGTNALMGVCFSSLTTGGTH